MKRALSLILALAMIMSMVTTVSFAAASGMSASDPIAAPADATLSSSKWPVAEKDADEWRLYYIGTIDKADFSLSNVGDIDPAKTVLGTDKLTYYSNDNHRYYAISIDRVPVRVSTLKKTSAHTWSQSGSDNKHYYSTGNTVDENDFYVVPNLTGATLEQSVDGSGNLKVTKLTVSGASAGGTIDYSTGYRVTKGSYYAKELTVSAPGTTAYHKGTDSTIKKILNATENTAFSSVTITPSVASDKLEYYPEGKAFRSKDTSGLTDGAKYLATFDDSGVRFYQPLKISLKGGSVPLTITNGSSATYTNKRDVGLLAAIESAIGANTIQSDTPVTLTMPGADDWDSFAFYKKVGTTETQLSASEELTVNGTNELVVKTTAGTIDDVEVGYTLNLGGIIYSGKLKISSGYAAAQTDKQSAQFFYEWSWMDSISGIKYLTLDDDATTPKGESDYHTDADFMVDPSGHTESRLQRQDCGVV